MARGWFVCLVVLLLLGLAGAAMADQTPDTLGQAAQIVAEMHRQGQSRAAIAAYLAEMIDQRITNMNSLEKMTILSNWLPWPFRQWSADAAFDRWRDQNIFDYQRQAAYAWNSRIGQCSEIASTTYYILKTSGVPGEVRIFNSGSHEFAVWGLAADADPKDPRTWGPDAYVVDPWQGLALNSDQAYENRYVGGNGDRVITDQTGAFDHGARVSNAVQDQEVSIFVLTNASNGLYLGPEASLLKRTRCSFEGGGVDCKPTDVVTYHLLLGPFPNRAAGQAALCQNITERKVFPLGVGLKGRWQASDTWYGLWDSSVRGECPSP